MLFQKIQLIFNRFIIFFCVKKINHENNNNNKFAKKMVIFEKDLPLMEITYLKKKNVTSLEIIL